jgi:hypothetical protein
MGKRLDLVASTATDVDGYQQALALVSDAASKRLPDVHAVRPTPPRRKTLTELSLPFTPMVKLQPTKTLDLPAALQDALRHAGMPFNQDSIEALQDSLLHTQLEREKKLQDHYASTATSTHERLAERSCQADRDARVIADALFKHTPFQHVHLANARLGKQLRDMETDLEMKDRELLEAEGNELSLSDPRVRAFIAKYGRQ